MVQTTKLILILFFNINYWLYSKDTAFELHLNVRQKTNEFVVCFFWGGGAESCLPKVASVYTIVHAFFVSFGFVHP